MSEDRVRGRADPKKAAAVGNAETFGLLGDSMALRRAIATAHKMAITSLPVLLLGETGTGKELFAPAVHRGRCWILGPCRSRSMVGRRPRPPRPPRPPPPNLLRRWCP